MQSLETIFSQLLSLIKQEKYTEALTLCEQTLTVYKDNDHLHYLKAFILWKRNGFFADGQVFHREIARALQLNPRHKDAYLLRGEMYLRIGAGEYMPLEKLSFSAEYYAKKAFSDYNRAAKIDPSDLTAQEGRKKAKRLMKGKDISPADSETSLNSFFTQIQTLLDDKKYAEALAVCDEALAIHEDNDHLPYLKALILWNKDGFNGDGRIFHELIDRTLQLNPRHKDAYLLKAEVLNKRGYADQALPYYQKATEIDPRDMAGWSGLMDVLFSLKQFQPLSQTCTRLIDMGNCPIADQAYFYRGVARKELQDYAGAAADFSKLLEINPTGAQGILIDRGICKFHLKDYAGAVEDYSKIIDLYPNQPEAYALRGDAKIEMGDLRGALKDFQAVVDLDPNAQAAWQAIGDLQQEILKQIPAGTPSLSVTLKKNHRKVLQIIDNGEVINFFELPQAPSLGKDNSSVGTGAVEIAKEPREEFPGYQEVVSAGKKRSSKAENKPGPAAPHKNLWTRAIFAVLVLVLLGCILAFSCRIYKDRTSASSAVLRAPQKTSGPGALEVEKEPREEFPGYQKPVFTNPQKVNLLKASDWGKLEQVQELIVSGADVNETDNITGETPLMMAAKRGHVAVVRELLSHGADTSRKANDGQTAFDKAVAFHQPEIASLLEQYKIEE